MQRIDRAPRLLPVKEQEILDRLFPPAQDVDDILGQLAAEEGGHGRQFAGEILQEAAEEIAAEGVRGQLEFLVLLGREGGEEFEIGVGVGGGGAGDGLEFPQGFEAGEEGGDLQFAAAAAEVVGGEGGGVGEEDGRVDFALGDHLD